MCGSGLSFIVFSYVYDLQKFLALFKVFLFVLLIYTSHYMGEITGCVVGQNKWKDMHVNLFKSNVNNK